MYLKIAMYEDRFQILEQDTRECISKIAQNGVKIVISSCPEMRGYERKLFLRGDDEDDDENELYYDDSCGEDFTNYLRALEEVVETFVVRLM